MLYDPKWECPSLAGFIGWLETQDPKQKYNFNDCSGLCLLGQYMTAIGIKWGKSPKTASGNWTGTNYVRTARQLFGDESFYALAAKPHTFGAALIRAKSIAQ